MRVGPGVFVGPVFLLAGVAALLLRRRLATRLDTTWLRGRSPDLTTQDKVAVAGGSAVLGGALGLLAGLGLLDWLSG
ncbi:hypothetical protein [Motilibacter deserti]|uniref:Uncharacterized protein n=1 Tax=Motilibacter deserti TaxID=2714956 RepID=A0ABX0H1D6_9ACTN|nr:hypothetical protein [Motilibacter deserti]NHC15635.1 hypothetical protein [Motilibacter deserti]